MGSRTAEVASVMAQVILLPRPLGDALGMDKTDD